MRCAHSQISMAYESRRIGRFDRVTAAPHTLVSTTGESRFSKLRPLDGTLFSLVFGLVMLGIVAVFSASFPEGSRNANLGTAYYLRLQAGYALLGLGGMLFISRLHPHALARWSFVAFAITLAVTMLTLTGQDFVVKSHGAPCWLKIWRYRIQPSEFAKLALLVYVASRLAEGRLNRTNFMRVGLRVLGATGALGLVLLAQRDQGMATVLVVTVLLLCYLGHIRGRWLAAMVGAAGLGLVIGILLEPYRLMRIKAFLDPLAYRTSFGWQILTMKTAIARGGIAGVGLGRCPEKWHFLPEPHTDSIFCVIGSELGFLGACAVLALTVVVIVRCLQIAARTPDNVGYFMASAVAIALGVQALVNTAVAVHLMPVTGLTLPFISAGGSSLVTCLAAIGVVMAVHRHTPRSAREE